MPAPLPFRPLPIDQHDVRYALGPDSLRRHPDVTPGTTSCFTWARSTVYPGTERRVWVHVPDRCAPARPARVVVCNDGWWYLDPDGAVRGAIVLDNLVGRGAIPETIGVFIDPGVGPGGERHRNAEYDAFDARYGTFVEEEILAEVGRDRLVSADPAHRLICGGSSGGNCAFTAAWLAPDRFGHVIAFLSSFAQMPGGNPYPELLAKGPPRRIRTFLQAGHRDLGWNRAEGNWLAENLRVAAALAEAGYDFRLVLGDGGHNPNHGGVLLPDALRWHWAAPPAG